MLAFKSDTRSGLEGWIGGAEEPIKGQDPCIVRPPSHLKMQGVLNLDPSCLVFIFRLFFFGSFWKSELWISKVGPSYSFIFFLFSIGFCSDDGKLNRVSKTGPQIAEKGLALLDQEISGDLLSLSCGTESLMWEYTSCSVYVHGAASCRGKENVNYHIDRHDDTMCMYSVRS